MSDANNTTEYSVGGPYHYPGDLHPCFRLNGPEGLVAIVFAYDSDLDAANWRAVTMAAALEAAYAR